MGPFERLTCTQQRIARLLHGLGPVKSRHHRSHAPTGSCNSAPPGCDSSTAAVACISTPAARFPSVFVPQDVAIMGKLHPGTRAPKFRRFKFTDCHWRILGLLSCLYCCESVGECSILSIKYAKLTMQCWIFNKVSQTESDHEIKELRKDSRIATYDAENNPRKTCMDASALLYHFEFIVAHHWRTHSHL